MRIPKIAVLIILATLPLTSGALAANIATISIQNASFVEKFKYSIDIYAVSTDEDFGVGESTIGLEFNDAVLSNYVLSNQNALFHNNSTYNAMSIVPDPGGTGHTNRIGLSISLTGGAVSGATLPDTDTLLATITFDIDPTPAVYRNETTQFAGLVGLSSMTSLPSSLPVFLIWNDTLDDPLICIPDISESPTTTADVSQLYDFTPTTTDVCNTIPDVGPLTFSIANPPTWANFDTNTGQLYGTPAYGDIGTTSGIVITATDGYGDSAEMAAFDITVSCPPPPTISGAPTTSIVAGSPYNFIPTVNDGCGELTFSITNPPAWADFNFNTNTGQMTGTPTLADTGTTTGIVINVEDENSSTDSMSAFDIEVTPNCTPPSISGNPDNTVVVGNLYSFTPTVSNGCEPLTYSVSNLPSWASFDQDTGQLSGTPTAAEEGPYDGIVITVTDNLNDTASLSAFDIQVTSSGNDENSSSGSDSGSSNGGGGGGCFISNLYAP